MRKRERGGEEDGVGPFRDGGSGEVLQALVLSTQPQETCWASGTGTLPSGAQSSSIGSRGIEGREGGRRREANG